MHSFFFPLYITIIIILYFRDVLADLYVLKYLQMIIIMVNGIKCVILDHFEL